MADTPDTPPVADDQPAPAPRRRAPRKTAAKVEGAAPKRPRRAAPKPAAENTGVIAKVEEGAATAAKTVRGAASRTASKTGDAVTGTARKAAAAVGAVKPRSTKRAAPRTPAKGRGKASAQRSTLDKATEKVGGKWGAAAIAGGLAAAGAAAAALLSLRSSTPKGDVPTPGRGAHQPDGTDSSKSFEAGIADEGSIPNA